MLLPAQTLEAFTTNGKTKIYRPLLRMFILAVFAGGFVSLGAIGNQIVSTGVEPTALGKMFSALIFPIGLLMVTFTGAELFTGNSLLIIPVLEKQANAGRMLLNWLIVYLGNFVGGVLISLIATYSHLFSMYDGALAQTVVNTANVKLNLTFSDAFLKAILCNVLVCIAVWVAACAKSAPGKIIGLYPPTALFVLCGFEHCIANMYFIPAAIFASAEYGIAAEGLNFGNMIVNNLIPVTLGNMLGGTVIIGLGFWFVHRSKKA